MYLSTRRRHLGFFDRHPAIGFSFFLYISSLRGCYLKLDGVSSAGVVYSTTHPLILIAPLKSRFTDSLRALPQVEVTIARSPRTLALCAIWCCISSQGFSIAETLRWVFSISTFYIVRPS